MRFRIIRGRSAAYSKTIAISESAFDFQFRQETLLNAPIGEYSKVHKGEGDGTYLSQFVRDVGNATCDNGETESHSCCTADE